MWLGFGGCCFALLIWHVCSLGLLFCFACVWLWVVSLFDFYFVMVWFCCLFVIFGCCFACGTCLFLWVCVLVFSVLICWLWALCLVFCNLGALWLVFVWLFLVVCLFDTIAWEFDGVCLFVITFACFGCLWFLLFCLLLLILLVEDLRWYVTVYWWLFRVSVVSGYLFVGLRCFYDCCLDAFYDLIVLSF